MFCFASNILYNTIAILRLLYFTLRCNIEMQNVGVVLNLSELRYKNVLSTVHSDTEMLL